MPNLCQGIKTTWENTIKTPHSAVYHMMISAVRGTRWTNDKKKLSITSRKKNYIKVKTKLNSVCKYCGQRNFNSDNSKKSDGNSAVHELNQIDPNDDYVTVSSLIVANNDREALRSVKDKPPSNKIHCASESIQGPEYFELCAQIYWLLTETRKACLRSKWQKNLVPVNNLKP